MTGLFGHGEGFDLFALGAPCVLIALVVYLRSQDKVEGFNGDLEVADRSGAPCHL